LYRYTTGGKAVGRAINASDAASYSSGITSSGSFSVTDGADPIALVGFPADAKYAFTVGLWRMQSTQRRLVSTLDPIM
jgi:hypothetical protein